MYGDGFVLLLKLQLKDLYYDIYIKWRVIYTHTHKLTTSRKPTWEISISTECA